MDVAGMIGAIEASAGAKTELVIGKPSWLMAEAACEALGLPLRNAPLSETASNLISQWAGCTE